MVKGSTYRFHQITGKTLALSGAALVALGIAYSLLLLPKKSDSTLVVGMMSGWAPLMTITPKGTYEGFDVDVVQELAQPMGKKLVIQDLGSLAMIRLYAVRISHTLISFFGTPFLKTLRGLHWYRSTIFKAPNNKKDLCYWLADLTAWRYLSLKDQELMEFDDYKLFKGLAVSDQLPISSCPLLNDASVLLSDELSSKLPYIHTIRANSFFKVSLGY